MTELILENGRRLAYRLDGPQGAPVVMFCNSLGTNLDLWSNQAQALQGRFRVLRYDARGHGASDVPDGEYAMDDLGGDALQLIDGLGIDRVRFCGLSMGGAIGQWLAANHPERVDRLVLANTGAVFPTPEVWSARMALVAQAGMAAVIEPTLDRWFTPGFREADPDAVERVRVMLLATPPTGYIGSCAALRDVDYRSLLPRITASTLVIAGEHDTATPPARAEELVAGIAGARLVMLDAAHMAVVEQAARFDRVLADFFD